ncbi:MAG: hypothetical protein HXK71_04225 [Clostridiales bacterium]|nr:hypothetical protein [Clostridiales bacterium]
MNINDETTGKTQLARDKKITANRRIKDSVFTKLFSEVKYLRLLYDSLYTDGTNYQDEDFRLLTLENVLVNDVYNDLGFMVGNRLIVLAEAQSTFNPNMALRFLIYMAHTYRDYIKEKGLDIYGRTQIKIPEPDFLLVYTGSEKLEEYRKLHLSDMYTQNERCKLELTVDVFAGTRDDGNILSQYIGFCRKYDEFGKRAKGKTEKLKALIATIEYCKAHNILREFLQKHAMEVIEMRMTLYTQEEIDAMKWDKAVMIGRKEGISIGRNEGLHDVAKNMKKLGFSDEDIKMATGLVSSKTE